MTDTQPRTATTSAERMRELVEQHIVAEMAGDTAAAVAVYTPDVEHDTVGSPSGPLHGLDAVSGFYDWLHDTLRTEHMTVTREWFATDAYIVEHQCQGAVVGEFMGIAGGGKPVDFRLLHVFEFRNGLISRENVWLDGGTIAAQLTT